MKIYEFSVPNNVTCKIKVEAVDEAEARQKLEDFDILEEVYEDDYEFDKAEIEYVTDLED